MNVNNVPTQMLYRCPSQHQRAHEDHAALQFTFYDVISARPGAPAALRSLQSRCLIPGLYSMHLERWLTYYPANQVGTEHIHRSDYKLCVTCRMKFVAWGKKHGMIMFESCCLVIIEKKGNYV